MSDFLKHECGIAFIRLLKPYAYYIEKYKTPIYGLEKLHLLMEKQHNRGQDGAGLMTVKLHPTPGKPFFYRHRSIDPAPIKDIFSTIYDKLGEVKDKAILNDADQLLSQFDFTSEVLLGHLRYGTHGKNAVSLCHPVLRRNNWITRNLAMAGNFNLTNVNELFSQLVDLGQHPIEPSDTITVLEKFGHFLDRGVEHIFDHYKDLGKSNKEITEYISRDLNLKKVIKKASRQFDGGYTMVGLMGHGDAFVLRDPIGIRPAYFYVDDEVVVAASERPCIQTAFDVATNKVEELKPGYSLIVKCDGTYSQERIFKSKKKRACSFERIYFSRGTDADIYEERKKLGLLLTEKVLDEIDHDYRYAVFSFIPNTAEVSFYGLIKGLELNLNEKKAKQLEEAFNAGKPAKDLQSILSLSARVEKIAVKDVKMRTFITEDSARDEMVSHVYDITYGSIKENVDTLVVLDDSIVRGTTLKTSILSNLGRLKPKKIVVVSSAPQIRYPDCYGIDMSRIGDLIAFRAAYALAIDKIGQEFPDEIYKKCKEAKGTEAFEQENFVRAIYKASTAEEISDKIAEMLKPTRLKSEVKIIYQPIENLHEACPDHKGDWYFTGHFPTPGGYKVVNQAFINFMEGKKQRAYELVS